MRKTLRIKMGEGKITLHLLDLVKTGEWDEDVGRFLEGEMPFALVAVAASQASALEKGLGDPNSLYVRAPSPSDPLIRLWRRPIARYFLTFPLLQRERQYLHPVVLPADEEEGGRVLAAYLSRVKERVVFPSEALARVEESYPLHSGARVVLLR